MTRPVKTRSYEMANRSRQAEETRRRIVEAGAELFVRDGYAKTSISAIAQRAGVAVPTVYASLRSKANILREVVRLTVRGDLEPAALRERPGWEAIEAEPDPREQLAMFAHFHRGICDREAAVFAQIEAAAGADPEATEILADHDRMRFEMQSRVARSLQRGGHLRPRLGEARAADVIWTLASERTYLALVRDRGWPADDYEQWLREQLEAALLAPAS